MVINSNIMVSVHPCDREDKFNCSQVCNKEGDEARCSCNVDYELTSDGKTCKEG